MLPTAATGMVPTAATGLLPAAGTGLLPAATPTLAACGAGIALPAAPWNPSIRKYITTPTTTAMITAPVKRDFIEIFLTISLQTQNIIPEAFSFRRFMPKDVFKIRT
jgi:hypothetical protein